MPTVEGAPESVPDLPETLARVLIVDDQPVNRTILEKQMEVMGVSAKSCASGIEALQMLSEPFDLVLTDHNMPEMDGLELTENIRATGNSVPIILLSSNPGFADQDPARAHLSAILQKPVSRRELFAKLETLGPASIITTPKPQTMNALASTQSAPQQQRLMRILAAEDNKTNQLVFSKMVKDLPINLQFANNGLEAVESFQDFQPDLIFMDISMPKMDGREATQKIRALEVDGNHIPIVALTAHAMTGDKEGILAAGLDHYLTKPLRKVEIHQMIQDNCPIDLKADFLAAIESIAQAG